MEKSDHSADRKHCDSTIDVATTGRIESLFQQQMSRLRRETDRIFVALMFFQWAGAIAMAFWITPQTWVGDQFFPHVHVWAAIILGGLITSFPVILALRFPGQSCTRHTIAIAQIMFSALLIHLSGGRIETHFHVFGSLAFLAFYRDWKVLLTASLVVAADHLVRGVFWPVSVFGIMVESPYRWIEHTAWVAFENVILVLYCVRGLRETWEISTRQALLEKTNLQIERQVNERTRELCAANQQLEEEVKERCQAEARETRLGRIIERSLNEIYVFDSQSFRFIEVNQRAIDNLQYSLEEIQQMTPLDIKPSYDVPSFHQLIKPLDDGSVDLLPFETVHQRKDGTQYPIEVQLQQSDWDSRIAFVAIVLDISDRRNAECQRDRIQAQLVDASRKAGMAEIATGVLHNVGNVLNSINVSTNLIGEQLHASRISGLNRATQLMQQNTDNFDCFLTQHDKGKMLPAYLSQLSETLQGERRLLLEEVKSISENLEHVKDIVQTQQAYARVGTAQETVDLPLLVERSLKIRAEFIRENQVTVTTQFDEIPSVISDGHKILQILINLISNATNAIVEASGNSRELAISVARISTQEIKIEVRDSGTGIAPEYISRVFAHGFTTRQDGHGFGLHSSALAAKAIGGSLSASSEGTGKGSIFTLTLPCVISPGRAPIVATANPIAHTPLAN